MNEEKFSKFIKEIRKKNNLTQKQMADKYNVTYQAVSKWENAVNMPDTMLIKQIAKDFNVSIDDMFEGEYKKKKNNKKIIIMLIIIFLLILGITLSIIFISSDNNFEFKTISTQCSNFNISGSISYNDVKSAIYIDNVRYCGGDDKEKYKNIECTLYESNNDINKKISSCNYNEKDEITLEDFLQTVSFTVDNYSKTCKEYKENSLYLEINATNVNNDITTYKIPLSLKKTCSN